MFKWNGCLNSNFSWQFSFVSTRIAAATLHIGHVGCNRHQPILRMKEIREKFDRYTTPIPFYMNDAPEGAMRFMVSFFINNHLVKLRCRFDPHDRSRAVVVPWFVLLLLVTSAMAHLTITRVTVLAHVFLCFILSIPFIKTHKTHRERSARINLRLVKRQSGITVHLNQ